VGFNGFNPKPPKNGGKILGSFHVRSWCNASILRTAVLGGIRWNPLSCPIREAFFAPSFYLSLTYHHVFYLVGPKFANTSPVVLNSIHIAADIP
jgi:hypothetical protein